MKLSFFFRQLTKLFQLESAWHRRMNRINFSLGVKAWSFRQNEGEPISRMKYEVNRWARVPAGWEKFHADFAFNSNLELISSARLMVSRYTLCVFLPLPGVHASISGVCKCSKRKYIENTSLNIEWHWKESGSGWADSADLRKLYCSFASLDSEVFIARMLLSRSISRCRGWWTHLPYFDSVSSPLAADNWKLNEVKWVRIWRFYTETPCAFINLQSRANDQPRHFCFFFAEPNNLGFLPSSSTVYPGTARDSLLRYQLSTIQLAYSHTTWLVLSGFVSHSLESVLENEILLHKNYRALNLGEEKKRNKNSERAENVYKVTKSALLSANSAQFSA